MNTFTGRKPSILDLYQQCQFDVPTLARQTGIAEETIKGMLGYSPVFQRVARQVLAQLSTLLHHEYTLENTDIPIVPFFSEIYALHSVSLPELAENAGVFPETINLMIQGHAVLQEYAVKVVSALSAMTQQTYSLENVDVNILMIMGEQSEVASLMQRIGQEYEASKQAIQGFAQGTAKHQFMTKRLENIAAHTEALSTLVDNETMNQLMQQFGE